MKLTTEKLDGIKTGSNGSKVFFNSIVAAFCTNVDQYNEYGKSVIFGDGLPLQAEIVEDIRAWMHANECAFKWNPGQFCILDNTMVFHSREPFKGVRKTFAAIANGEKEVIKGLPHHVLKNSLRLPMFGVNFD